MGRFTIDFSEPWPDATAEEMVDLMFSAPLWAHDENGVGVAGDSRARRHRGLVGVPLQSAV